MFVDMKYLNLFLVIDICICIYVYNCIINFFKVYDRNFIIDKLEVRSCEVRIKFDFEAI